ncbi:hypothetical protein Ae717Ps2_3146 [Pseudonocardia sp. Ae717_Ps2]|nr:hypothetical protein Ae717Ps2_0032 [Pseudonocardia sp. Ae717_Ps2]OLM32251.1 hypothetical protein Ae717Ps2_3146 [Pseudonocardia sp. Ae717_Ps2]
MGWLSSTAKGGARVGRAAVAREVAASQHAKHHRRGRHTEEASGPVHCRSCGVRVRSGMGDVCSRPRCMKAAVR